MWLEIALVIAGLVYAIVQNSSKAAAPIITTSQDETADSRFHVQYLQQLLAVQAAQISNINGIYGFMLPVVLFLLQYVAAPIENEYVRWVLYGLYSILALIMLAFIGMRRPELYSSNDPLALGNRNSISASDLAKTHFVLHTLLTENEGTLRTKHRGLPYVLLAGIIITVVGGAFDGAQRPQAQAVSFPTPLPVIVQTPTPQTPPATAPSGSGAGKRPGKPPLGAKAPFQTPTPSAKPRLAPSGIIR